jgi:hypothetical protein
MVLIEEHSFMTQVALFGQRHCQMKAGGLNKGEVMFLGDGVN